MTDVKNIKLMYDVLMFSYTYRYTFTYKATPNTNTRTPSFFNFNTNTKNFKNINSYVRRKNTTFIGKTPIYFGPS